MFRRKPKPIVVDLTNEAYSRWLRAGAPQPIAWFLNLHPEQQAQCAILGDEHYQDLAIAVGYAIADPALAEASIEAEGDPAVIEEFMLRRLAAERSSTVSSPAPVPSMSMGGTKRRSEDREHDDRVTQDTGRTFLGMKPDPVHAKSPPMENAEEGVA